MPPPIPSNDSTMAFDHSPPNENEDLNLCAGMTPGAGYELKKILGKGGFSEVWAASGPNGPCALKIIKPIQQLIDLERRALDELRRHRVSHPNILPVRGDWRWGSALVIEMELADISLMDLHKRTSGGIPRGQLLSYIMEAADALDYLNGMGLRHRDVKPQNLLLKNGHVLVADFSLAKFSEKTEGSLTGQHSVGFAAPEALEYPRTVTPWSDQFSLAATYCYLSTGRVPFVDGRTSTAPVSLTGWPAHERAVLFQALQRAPEARFVDCRAFVQALTGPRFHVPSSLPERRINSLGMEFLLIPKGTFQRGSPIGESGRTYAEGPQRIIHLTRPYFLGVHQVTQEQFQRVLGINPSHFRDVPGEDTGQFPAEQVTWHQAVEFCQRLSDLPEEKLAGRRYRLPTEAEWEYACRGATDSILPFHLQTTDSDRLSSHEANFNGTLPYGGAARGPWLQRPSVIGSYPPNVLGLHDMHGNVKEWCADWYDERYYDGKKTRDLKGPEKGQTRVHRGGSWFSAAVLCRAACRDARKPEDPSNEIGFRVVLEEG